MTAPYTERQVLLTLSYLAYSGFYHIDAGDTPDIYRWIERWLATLPPVRDRWSVVWGPTVFRFPFTVFSDNLMYVVRSLTDPHEYVVVIRGTNPVSWPNVLFEDLLVRGQWTWNYGDVPVSLQPRLSLGTMTGLRILQRMKAPPGLPGQRTTLREFLTSALANNPGEKIRICITGHSLGGALAVAVAMWLHDTRRGHLPSAQKPWDAEERATLSVVPFATPTPGNADFARWFDDNLGSCCDRVTNQLDVVSHIWDRDTIQHLPDLYQPRARMNPIVHLAWRWSQHSVTERGYRHVRADQAPLAGRFEPYWGSSFIAQALHQHILGYPLLLGLADLLDLDLLLPAIPVAPVIHRGAPHAMSSRAVSSQAASRHAAPAATRWPTRLPRPPWRTGR